MISLTQIKNDKRSLEYNCLGFPDNWYPLDDVLRSLSNWTPLSIRVCETKEVLFRDEILKKSYRRKQLDEILGV